MGWRRWCGRGKFSPRPARGAGRTNRLADRQLFLVHDRPPTGSETPCALWSGATAAGWTLDVGDGPNRIDRFFAERASGGVFAVFSPISGR